MNARAKLFKNGRSQAVRLPARYRFDGEEVEVRPGPNPGEITLSPVVVDNRTWHEFFAYIDSLGLTDEDFSAFEGLRDGSPPPPDPFGDD